MNRTLLTVVMLAATMGATAARAEHFGRGGGEHHGGSGGAIRYGGNGGGGRVGGGYGSGGAYGGSYGRGEYREHGYEHRGFGYGLGYGYRAPVVRGHYEWRVVPRWVPGFPQQVFIDGYWQTVPGQGHWENRSEQVWVGW
jgi:hypothetical protein